MADNENAAADAGQAPPEKASAKGKLLAAGIVSFIIIVETTVAYFVFPPAQDTSALETERLGDAPEAEAELEGSAPEANEDPLVEFPLGDFTISAFQPVSNTTLRIDFRLFGLAKKDDEEELTSMHAGLEHRFREQVIVTIRSAEITDLSDPGLGLIKRKILEKTNRAFGKSLLQEIIINDFSFVEQ